jgi:hypothetical protein
MIPRLKGKTRNVRMKNKEAQDHELTETATLESGRETSDSSF